MEKGKIDYQVPVTLPNGPKGNGDMQAGKWRYASRPKWRYASRKSEDEVRHLPAIELEWAW